MINQIVLVGSLLQKPKDINGRTSSFIMQVQRHYTGPSGEALYDIIPVQLWRGAADYTLEVCTEGDLIGVKGRIEKDADREMKVVAERITIISKKE